jgi:hypothetical protein
MAKNCCLPCLERERVHESARLFPTGCLPFDLQYQKDVLGVGIK